MSTDLNVKTKSVSSQRNQVTKAQTIFNLHFDIERDHLMNCYNKTRTVFNNTNHKGWGFEYEVRKSIQENLASNIRVGTGEIIHHEMGLLKQSKQIDVVVQNARYPRLPVAGDMETYLYETVVSFGEVKGLLERAHIKKFAETVSEIQSYPSLLENKVGNKNAPVFDVSERKIRPFSFILAADTKAHNLEELCEWVGSITKNDDRYCISSMKDENDRRYFNHKFIDGIFILNRGAIVADSYPFRSSYKSKNKLNDKMWMVYENNPLAWFYTIINQVCLHYSYTEFSLAKYLGKLKRKHY